MSPRRDMLGPLTLPNGAENASRAFVRGVSAFLRGPMRIAPSQVRPLQHRRLYGIIVQPEPVSEGAHWYGTWFGEWMGNV